MGLKSSPDFAQEVMESVLHDIEVIKDAGCTRQKLSSCRRDGTCPSMAKLVASDECLPRAQRMPLGGASIMMEKAGLVSINQSLGKLL